VEGGEFSGFLHGALSGESKCKGEMRGFFTAFRMTNSKGCVQNDKLKKDAFRMTDSKGWGQNAE